LGHHAYFHYLVNLINLDRVKNFNWGVPKYTTIIRGMRDGTQKIEETHRESNTSLPMAGL